MSTVTTDVRYGPMSGIITDRVVYSAQITDGGFRSRYGGLQLLGATWVATYEAAPDKDHVNGTLTCAWAKQSSRCSGKLCGNCPLTSKEYKTLIAVGHRDYNEQLHLRLPKGYRWLQTQQCAQRRQPKPLVKRHPAACFSQPPEPEVWIGSIVINRPRGEIPWCPRTVTGRISDMAPSTNRRSPADILKSLRRAKLRVAALIGDGQACSG
jgi:hypothetical protein